MARLRTDRNAQYDLLTAALIGAAVGVSATLLLRSVGGTRSRRHHVLDPALEAVDKAVEREIRDLQKQLRRQRRRINL